MRTDSNTVLSLTPSVPPKKSTLAKASSESGAVFASDFNKAKEAHSPRKSSATNESSASSAVTSSSSSGDPSSTSKVLDKTSVSVDAKGNEIASTTEVSDVAVAATVSIDKSGKALQGEGEGLPIGGSAVATSEKEKMLTSTALSPESEVLQNVEGNSKSSLQLDTATQEVVASTTAGQNEATDQIIIAGQNEATDPIVIAGQNEATNQIAITGQNEATNQIAITGQNEATDQVAAQNASGNTVSLLGLGAIKQATPSDQLNKVNLVPVDSEENVFEPSSEQSNGELSWVLSQMDASVAKGAPINSTGDVDTAKAAASIAASALGAVNKEGRTEAVSSALLGASGTPVSASVSTEANVDSADALLGEDGLLMNEPIELRKKEQEAMIGRMSAQLDGSMADDSTTGGLNSSLQSNNLNRTAQGIAAATVVQNPQQNLAMSLPPGHPGWASEMTQKVAWIARDGGHTAHIRLDPPELGSLTVKISVDSDSNTQVSFVAATPQARDLLEGQMGRLREMLAQQGMDLSRADVDVSQQDASGTQERGNYRNSGTNQGEVAVNDELDNELIANNASYVSASGVDYYA
jgi:flagellar hook-length control protein FliK